MIHVLHFTSASRRWAARSASRAATRSRKHRALIQSRIERAYYAECSGVQINVMDIAKVFNEGERLINQGADEPTLRAGIKAFVETIRQN
jgi:hypothetical protein